LKEKSVFNNKVDIWSAGCILYELVVGKMAFTCDGAVREYRHPAALELEKAGAFDGEIKRSITNTINRLLQFDPALRPSATSLLSECLQHSQQLIEPIGTNMRIRHEFHQSPGNQKAGIEFPHNWPISFTSPVQGICF
jgi:serine/threonine protein kinase